MEKIPTEAQEQERFFTWIYSMERQYPHLALCFASMAGERMRPGQAMNAIRRGNRAGVPDIIFPYPANGYHGLFIELKRRKKYKVSDIQHLWIKNLKELGYCATVCYGSDDAILMVRKYLGIDE